MRKKLVVADLPENPTDEQKEAFASSVKAAIEDLYLIPGSSNSGKSAFLATVLQKIVGTTHLEGTLPEGVTTEPIHPRFINRLEKVLKRKIKVSR